MASKTSSTAIRGQYYGTAAAVGKLGAFIGTWGLSCILFKTPLSHWCWSFELAFPPMIKGKFVDACVVQVPQPRLAFGGPTSLKGNTGPFWVSSGNSILLTPTPSEMNDKIRFISFECSGGSLLYEAPYARWHGWRRPSGVSPSQVSKDEFGCWYILIVPKILGRAWIRYLTDGFVWQQYVYAGWSWENGHVVGERERARKDWWTKL